MFTCFKEPFSLSFTKRARIFIPVKQQDISLKDIIINAKMYNRSNIEYTSLLIQLITYVVIVDPKRKKFLLNKRLGGDSRLLDKTSLGFGGHIDASDYKSLSFDDIAYLGAERELREELILNKKQLNLKHIGYTFSASGETNNHLGIIFVLETGSAFVKEKNKLKIFWASAREILDSHYFQLESWSKSIFDYFYEDNYLENVYKSYFI